MRSVIGLDGWNIAVHWDRLYGGDSFFIPSVNVDNDKQAIAMSAEQAGCVISLKMVVEDDIQGIRVWVKRGVL
jgi:hypothetical protein